ncbi:DinB family protein [Lacrimispora sp.]|uniref:DinB family protein n=1 Tax=Lacrimispora sp. TaxID=2719234 RepID=UPI003995BA78
MKYFGEGLSEIHKELNQIIRKADKIEQSKNLFLMLHAKLHLSEISGTEQNEVDNLINDLSHNEYAIMPTVKDETIAWVIWHIARIEDLTMSILVANENQLFTDKLKQKMNAPITDTGNALSDDEIISLSKNLIMQEVLHYRNEVGKRTRQIVKKLKPEDMKRKVSSQGLEKILRDGGVTSQEKSIWLLDYWAKKDIAGILLMPPTRHVMLHINDCYKWKQFFRTKKTFYLS